MPISLSMADSINKITNFDKLRPQPCPVRLIRIGGNHDGAYLIPDDLEGIQACFSPGVNNFKFFEDELVYRFGIKCHMCDYSSDPEKFSTPLIENLQSFEKKWLEPDSNIDSVTLEDWVERRVGKSADNLLLQMDIEGAEYRNLMGAESDLLNKFRIIVLELHMPAASLASNVDVEDVRQVIDKLYDTHICVHARANNCCGHTLHTASGMNIPNVMELTYLRRDRFARGTQARIPPQIPHPLDIPFNLHNIRPLHLNQAWLSRGERSLESTLKVIEDCFSHDLVSALGWRIGTHHMRRGLITCMNKDVCIPYLVDTTVNINNT